MTEHLTIAIDGPAGAGKSTIAKKLAAEFGIIYVDTGAMYRATALHMMAAGVNLADEDAVVQEMNAVAIELAYENHHQRVSLNGEDVTDDIRQQAVGENASRISQYLPVRQKLVEMQQAMAVKESLVMDGRDIGTHVLPDASVKVYLSADVMVRARRRYRQLAEVGETPDLEVIAEEIRDRDHRDMNREHAPLVQADDATLIDTSSLNIEETVNAIIQLVERS